MIDSVVGEISEVSKERSEVVVQAGPVGVRFRVPARSSFMGRREGAYASVYSSMVVSNDKPHLYGFPNSEDRRVFEKLCSVPGIGPATAMRVLDGMDIDDLSTCLASCSVEPLKSVKGIGTKAALAIMREGRKWKL